MTRSGALALLIPAMLVMGCPEIWNNVARELDRAVPVELEFGTDKISVTGWKRDDGLIIWSRDIVVGVASPTRGLTSYKYQQWPNKTIPFDDSAIRRNAAVTSLLQQGMTAWSAKTGLVFIPRSTEENFLKVELESNNAACGSSAFGMAGGAQHFKISADLTCGVESVIHELGHAIGLLHEHQRWDRDDYVKVDLSQLDTTQKGCSLLEWEKDYQKILSGTFISGPYDINSIMHYDSRSVCQKSNAKPILSAKSGAALPTNTVISDGDACAVWEIYDLPRFRAENCYQSGLDCRRAQRPFAWSCNGPIPNKPCINISEPSDPDSWNDNYLCGVVSSNLMYVSNAADLPPAGDLCAWHCALLNEPQESAIHGWSDNAICTRVCRSREGEEVVNPCFEFSFSSNGPDPNRTCIQLYEPNDRDGWQNNYLCWSTGCGGG